MPKSSLRQLLKFVRVFGLSKGVRLWASLVWQQSRHATLLTLRVPGTAAPIRLRPRDLPIFWQIMVMRENDFSELPQCKRAEAAYRSILLAGERPVIVDCGGHVGLSSVWFASRFPEATVYVVEPDAANYKLLQENTAAYKGVTALNGGIWSRSCDLGIANPNSGSASFQLREQGNLELPASGGALRGYTIDEIAAREPNQQLFLVKIDVEGAESEVFEGETDWLGETAVVIIELHDWLLPGQGTSRSFFRKLGAHAFDVILRGENLLLFRVGERTAQDPAGTVEKQVAEALA